MITSDFSYRPAKIPEQREVLKPPKQKKGKGEKEEGLGAIAKRSIVKAIAGVNTIKAKVKKKKVEESKVPQNEIPVEGGKGLKDMPPEVVLQILGSVTGTPEEKARDLANFGQTNKEYYGLASDLTLWEQSFEQIQAEFEAKKDYLNTQREEYKSVKQKFLNHPWHDKFFFEKAFLCEKDPKTRQQYFNLILSFLHESHNLWPKYCDVFSPETSISLTRDALDKWGKDLKISSKQRKALEKLGKNHQKDKNNSKFHPIETEELHYLLERLRNI